MSLAYYNSIRKNGYEYIGRNFVGLGRDMHVLVGNMSYVMDFTILESIEANIDPSLSNVVFRVSFVEITYLAINRKYGLMTFTYGIKEITFKTPYKDPEMSELFSKVITYYQLGLYLMRRSLEVLRKFHWMILGGRFNQLSHVSSPLLSKPGE
ncbi:hypothetical protein Tco_0817038 [Tanacetum coccineum]